MKVFNATEVIDYITDGLGDLPFDRLTEIANVIGQVEGNQFEGPIYIEHPDTYDGQAFKARLGAEDYWLVKRRP